MDDQLTIYWTILGVCLLLSAFFSSSETALMSMGKVRVRQLKERHARLGNLVEYLLVRPDRLIGTILIGNNIVNTAASSAATAIAIALVPGHPVLVATFGVTVLLLVFAEVTPKVIARAKPDVVSMLVVQPLTLIYRVLGPFVGIFNTLPRLIMFFLSGGVKRSTSTSEDIKTIAVLGREEGIIGLDEQEMIHSVVEFGALNAGQLMVSRVDILSLDLDLPREEEIDLVIESGHSRIPVYRGSKDHIDGVLQARDFLVAWRRGEAEGIERFVRPPFFIPESMRVSTLFREFRARNERMAIVVDEYGGTAGIVTLEDVLGEIVGEIVDEDRDVSLLAARRDGSVTVSGQIALDDLNAKAGLELPDEEFQTLSGLLVNHLGRVPYSGEEIALPGVVFQVLDADHRRIYRLAMKKVAGS